MITATVINAYFPGIPIAASVIFFIIVSSLLNILGIKVANGVNWVLTGFQVLVALLFAVFAFAYVFSARGPAGLVSVSPFVNASSGMVPIAAGAAVAVYAFLGFDAVTTLAEETKDPHHTLPRALLLLVVLAGLIFVVVAYATQLVHPGQVFRNPDSAANEIGLAVGGRLLNSLYTGGIIAGGATCGIAAQASAARLLFAMGRDGVLPSRFFGRLHPRFHTPARNICLIGIFGLLAVGLNIASAASFINFGAFTAFILVNVSALLLAVRRPGTSRGLHRVMTIAFPVVGAVIDAALFATLDHRALILGGTWLVLGVVYLAYLTRLFRRPAPETRFIETADEVIDLGAAPMSMSAR